MSLKWYKMNIGALSKKLRCRKSIAECPMVFPGRAEGPQLDLPDHWLSSEAKNLIERMVVKAPSWDRENSHVCCVFIFGSFLLFNWVFFVATQSHDSKKPARSWKIRIPARDWVVVIFMNWRMMLGSMDQSITSHKISARPNISKHRRMQSRVFRIVRLFILVLGIFPIDLHPEFWIARGASFLWHHLRRPKTSKSKMWKLGNLTRW